MSRLIDLTGQRFGRLIVIKRGENSAKGEARWICKCDCGKETLIWGCSLRKGSTQSCGCLAKEKLLRARTTHKGSKTRLYRTWLSMRARTENQSHYAYKDYGGRGVAICDEWEHDFSTFRDWALQNGYADNLTIDRIDNDKSYSPENCRWVDMKTQGNNRRTNNNITYDGETRTLTEWAHLLNIRKDTLARRLKLGWSVEKALTTPVKKKK